MANNQEYELKFTGEEIDERLELVSTIKDQVRQNIADIGGKFGSVAYEGGVIRFYDSEGGTQLGAVTITGTSYTVNVATNVASSNFTVLDSDKTSLITLTPTTKSMEFGSSVNEDYPEDYTFKLEVDNGSGYVDRTPEGNGIKQGGSASVDIRPFLRTGTNRVRIVVTGASSNQPRTLGYTVTLTSLSLRCTHPWHQVWMQGMDYEIKNIFIAGNIAKTLHVKVGDVELEPRTIPASTSYDKVPTTYSLTNNAPASSGVVPVELWVTGDNVTTETIRYNIMYVATEDIGKVALICTNNVKSTAMNFAEETLLQYAVYGVSSIRSEVTSAIKGDTTTILDITQDVAAQIVYSLTTRLQIETTEQSGITLTVRLAADTTSVEHTIAIDNSNAYLATEGYKFYLNPSLGSNNSPDRELIQNSAIVEDDNYKTVYQGRWTNYTFADDAWGRDSDGNRALVAKAGSELVVEGLTPLRYSKFSKTNSVTIELMYRASNIADYDKPILTCIDTEEYNENSVGLVIFPTRVLLLGTSVRQELFQQLPLSEDRIHHVTVVIQRGYAGTSLNLAHIYINGCENATFKFAGGNTFYNELGDNQLRLGQQSTDSCLYTTRIYDFALEANQIFANYLNAMIETAEISRQGLREDNAIADGTSISYDLAKQAGFNCFVIEMPNDVPIPSLSNPVSYSSGVNYHLEYNDNPEWNVSIYDAPIDRQGTTSSLYEWANLTAKNKKEIRWVYPNLKDKDGNVLEEIGKDGYIEGYGLSPKVSRITWKKNVASQPQGHKMAATAMYNDLFKIIMGGAEKIVADKILPTTGARVAVSQHPFLGFQKFSNGTYKFIGLYTGGADKKDKKTFGYNEVEKFPNLMMIEGPNHDPRMTRFLVPWTEDVFYDSSAETLSIGARSAADGARQEGWDADIVADYSSDDSADESAIQSLYESEFKPAYDAIVYNSPYIASVAESGCTLEEINSNVSEFLKGKTRGYSNILMTFYNENYELVYYRIKTGKYEVLPKSTHDMLTYLGLSGKPTTSDIVAARTSKWISAVGNVVNLREAYFSQIFKEFFGISDNDAKNTYWRKFLAVAINAITKVNEGGKWGFNEDDTDTLFQNDNNGQDTKDYFVEPDDTSSNGDDIFQGRTSAFWYALRQNCKEQLRGMMKEVADAMYTLAEKLNLVAPTIHQTIFNVIDFYFWRKSSKYFPATAYNQDTQLAYIDVWFSDPDRVYNNVPPLTQIHGDHYETEREWVAKRIVYMFSKYQIGAFEADNADGMGSLEFTPAEAFTMDVTPAIDLYPRVSYGGSVTENSQRTKAGDVCQLPLSASGTTGNYIKSMDWLSDLGDLTDLKLSPRSAADAAISFSVKGKRLRRLKVGDASKSSSDIKFNAATLGVESEALEVLDARNVSTVEGSVSLQKCPRIREAYLSGTAVKSVIPPKGGRLLVLDLPDTVQDLILNELNLLQEEGLQLSETALGNIRNIYINSCNNINPVDLLQRIFNTANNQLTAIGIIWKGWLVDTDGSVLKMFGDIAKKAGADGGYTGVDFTEDITLTSLPNISGALDASGLAGVYQEDIDAILLRLPNLLLKYDPSKLYISFQDPEVLRVLLANGVGDGIGITADAAEKVTSISSWFYNNTTIRLFNEFEKFGITRLDHSSFKGCSSLESLTFPATIKHIDVQVFQQCPLLVIEDLKLPNLEFLGNGSFLGVVGLKKVSNLGKVTSFGASVFANCSGLESINLHEGIVELGNGTFQGCSSLKTVTLPQSLKKVHSLFNSTSGIVSVNYDHVTTYDGECNAVTSLKSVGSLKSLTNSLTNFAFHNCVNLELDISNMNGITGAGNSAFGYCAKVTGILNIPNCTTLGTQAFLGTSITRVEDIGSANVGASTFANCKSLMYADIHKSSTIGGFSGCTALEEVNLEGSTATQLYESAFKDCTSLKSLVLPDTLTTVGRFCFNNATGITTFSIPNNITSIGQDGFQLLNAMIDEVNLPNLSSMPLGGIKAKRINKVISLGLITSTNNPVTGEVGTIVYPSTLTSGGDLFRNLTVTEWVKMEPTTPPTVAGNWLTKATIPVVYVPDESVEAYKTATYWVNIADKIKGISEMPAE